MSAATATRPPEPQAWSADPFGRENKLQPWHHDRLAVVCVRQSSPQQVLSHQESTRLQYGLVARAKALGWLDDRVLVIDDDLGKSASSAVGRAGGTPICVVAS